MRRSRSVAVRAVKRWTRFSVVLWLVLGVSVTSPGVATSADEAPRLTFAQLTDSIRANLDVTQNIKARVGSEVEILGFIIPAGPPDLSFFLLSRVSAFGNYCCEVPTGQDETVYVFAAKGVRVLYDPLRVYRIRGIFEAGKHVDATYGVSLFRVRNASVEIAAGATIFKVGETPPPAPKP